MTFGWGEVTGGEMTMGRNDRIPYIHVCNIIIMHCEEKHHTMKIVIIKIHVLLLCN